MNIKEAREHMNMSRQDISDWLGIPYRTLTNWEGGERSCPDYVERLIVEKILKGKEVNTMNKFELKRNTREIRYKNRKEICEGCTLYGERDMDPETIKVFNDKHEALEALKGYESSIHELSDPIGIFYSVEEFYVEENIYDEDGEFKDYVCVWGYSHMDLSMFDEKEDEE